MTSPVAANYIYRNYDLLTDAYFETNDVIYCAFSIADANGNLGTSIFKKIEQYIMPKAREYGCWVVLSIAPESEWVTLCNPDNNLVDTFINNIINAINKYDLDGIDIDWEYPESTQTTWFTNLVSKLDAKMNENNPYHLLTAAIGGGMWQHDNYDLSVSKDYLDYINLMCYGLCSASGYYQNALYKSSSYNDSTNKVGKTLTSCSIDESVEIFTSTYDIPSQQLIVGVPFYGVKQTLTDGEWVSGGSIFYTTLVNSYINNSDYKYVFDDVSKVPYLISNDGTIFISYENSESLTIKCKYIIDNNLGGIMNWETGCDTTGELMDTIKIALGK